MQASVAFLIRVQASSQEQSSFLFGGSGRRGSRTAVKDILACRSFLHHGLVPPNSASVIFRAGDYGVSAIIKSA